jgi:hypothetical protein
MGAMLNGLSPDILWSIFSPVPDVLTPSDQDQSVTTPGEENAQLADITTTVIVNDPEVSPVILPNPGNDDPLPINPPLGFSGQNLLWLSENTGAVKFTVVTPPRVGGLEIGYLMTDAEGKIDGIDPLDPNYLTAATTSGQYRTILDTLGDGDLQIDNLSRVLPLSADNFYSFYVSLNNTTDNLAQGGLEDLAMAIALGQMVFGSPFFNGDLPTPLTVLEIPGAYELAWDLNGDGKFDDFSIRVEPSDGQPPRGAERQGGQESEVIDLGDLQGQQVNLELTIQSEAYNTNILGFYRAETLQGAVIDPLTGGLLNPGEAGYLQAAVAQWADQPVLSTGSTDRFSATVSVEGGGFWVPFLITNGTLEQLLDGDSGNDPLVFTPFLGASPDRLDHVKLLADNTFGFEDLVVNSDFDYDDLVVRVNVVPV